MAKPARGAKATSSPATKSGSSENAFSVQVKVQLELSSDTPMFYVNHVEVSHSRHEFTLAIARLQSRFSPTALEELRETGRLVAPADAQILVPPTLMQPLINALQKQLAIYEEQEGKLGGSKNGD